VSLRALYSIARILLKLVLGRGVRSSYSQDGEDILVETFLPKDKIGTYVDVGAYHPIQYSNTYRLYRRGWKGVVVEPNASLRPLFSFFRPRDRFVQEGVASVAGTSTYYEFSDGAYNTFSKQQADIVRSQPYPAFVRERSMRVRPLSEMLREQGVTAVDVLSVDVEGFDVEVLSTLDWEHPPRLIAIEDTTFTMAQPSASEAYRFLTEKEYKLVAAAPRTLIFQYKS